MKKLFSLSLFLFFCYAQSFSQVNGYAKVTSISGTTLSLSNVNETYDAFVAGEKAIIMQMQDDVIGVTGDNSSFGDIGSIQSTGLYEIITLSSITPGSLQTIYEQNFNTNGLTSDGGPNGWSMTNNPGGGSVTVETANNRFESAQDGSAVQDNTVIWTSNTIDISNFTDVSISLDIGESTNNNEAADYISVDYILDGVNTQFDYQNDEFGSVTSSVSGLNGSTLVVQVTLFNNFDETHYLDNVLVQGTSETTLNITNSLTNSYNTGTNSSVQIITYPTLDDGGGNYTTAGDITALDWNGNIGGVIAFKVDGTLTLLDNISADGAGFNGASPNLDGNSAGCSETPYRTNTGDNHANKGEGIYKPDLTANPEFAAARGKILNGGGGGNSHNAGGAGGGNYSAGGNGGLGYPSCNPSAGGLGGIALSSYVSPSRIFMGGGGGAGEGNNGAATGGANGGGIILISANALETTSGCTGVSISANGDDSNDTGGNDAAGGAGAGGSIVLQIPNYNVNPSCQLTVEANGGNGGSVNDAATHGGGGGGGMGVVIYSIPTPTTNITTNTDPGNGGDNDNSGTGGTAPPGEGTPGTGGGVVDDSNSPLPVEYIDFKGRSEGDQVILYWTTATELNNDYFDVQMSRDGTSFVNVGKVNGFGTTNSTQDYQFSHYNQFNGITYYRLKQVDYDGTYAYSKIIFVEHHISFESFKVDIYSNPIKDNIIRLKILSDSNEKVSISLRNAQGILFKKVEIDPNDLSKEIQIDGHGLQPGIYVLNINQGTYHAIKKIKVN